MTQPRSRYQLTALFPLLVAGLLVGGCDRGPKQPSIVLITIDTLRADHLGCYGYDAPTSPVIDQLAREGVRVERTYAAAPITAPSHATLLTGRYPLRHGVRTNGAFALADSEQTLAEILQQNGYQTAAFVGAIPLDHRFGFAQGFDHFDDDMSQSVLRGKTVEPWYGIPLVDRERRADEVIEPALAWLRARANDGPLFLWVHLFDPHHPYAPPPEFAERFALDTAPARRQDRELRRLVRDGEPWHAWLAGLSSIDQVIGRYDAEIAYADSQVGRLLDAIDELERRDDTAVVLTADHGEGMGGHGEYFFHGDLVYESTARVPLVVRAPWRLPAGSVSRIHARTVDLMPTLLDLVQIDTPTGLDGSSLLSALESADNSFAPRPALVEAAYRDGSGRARYAYIEDRLKLIWSEPLGDGPERRECYDLVADPRELRNLAAERPEVVAAMTGRLEALLESLTTAGSVSVEVSPEVIEALQSLGYIGGGGGGGQPQPTRTPP